MRPLQLYLRVGGQVVSRGVLSDHSVGLDVQVPVHTEITTTLSQHLDQRITTRRGAGPQYSHSWPVGGRGRALCCGCGRLGLFVFRGGAPGFDPRCAGGDGRAGLHLKQQTCYTPFPISQCTAVTDTYFNTLEAVRPRPLLLRAPPLPLTVAKVTVSTLCWSRIQT